MKKINKKALFIFTSLVGGVNLSYANENIFLCQTNNSEISIEKDESTLTYRFTRNGKNEMIHTGKDFTYNTYFRPMVDYFSVSFYVGKYKYSIFSDYDGQVSDVYANGVRVYKGTSEPVATIKCVTTDIDRIRELKTLIKCSTDELGC